MEGLPVSIAVTATVAGLWSRAAPFLIALLIAGCGDDAAQQPSETTTKTAVVKASDYGNDWPLLVSEARIGCVPPSAAYLEIAGRQCALNGKALAIGMERCDDVSKTGNAVAFGVLAEKALTLCPTRN